MSSENFFVIKIELSPSNPPNDKFTLSIHLGSQISTTFAARFIMPEPRRTTPFTVEL